MRVYIAHTKQSRCVMCFFFISFAIIAATQIQPSKNPSIRDCGNLIFIIKPGAWFRTTAIESHEQQMHTLASDGNATERWEQNKGEKNNERDRTDHYKAKKKKINRWVIKQFSCLVFYQHNSHASRNHFKYIVLLKNHSFHLIFSSDSHNML